MEPGDGDRVRQSVRGGALNTDGLIGRGRVRRVGAARSHPPAGSEDGTGPSGPGSGASPRTMRTRMTMGALPWSLGASPVPPKKRSFCRLSMTADVAGKRAEADPFVRMRYAANRFRGTGL